MDELIRQLTQVPDATPAPTVLAVLAATLLSFVLSLVIVFTYRATHRGPSYSQSATHTLVIMAVVTSAIMLIIGSNIARAFSLVGALSVIRFRSAVKNPRDVGFLYFAMAVGMAAGTRLYAVAAVLTAVLCAIMFLLARFSVGTKPFRQALLRVILGRESAAEAGLEALLGRHTGSYALLASEATSGDTVELVYSVDLAEAEDAGLLEAIRAATGVQRVSLQRGYQQVHADA